MAVTGSYGVTIDLTNLTTSDREEAQIKISQSLSQLFADGTGAGQVNKIWQDIRPLTDGGNESLDMAPTPSSGSSGAVTFAAIKAILIWAPSTNTTNLTLTGTFLYLAAGDAVNALKPGGVFLLTDPSAAGMTVTNTTKDTVIVTNSSGAAATYGIIVAGI